MVNNSSASSVFHYLRNFNIHHGVTQSQNRAVLHSFGDHEELVSFVFPMPAPTRTREFVTKKLALKVARGEYIILFYSVNEEELLPTMAEKDHDSGELVRSRFTTSPTLT